jgi:hypothetical protein
MGDEEAPAVGRERRQCAHEDGKKMVLESADCTFRCVAAMDVRRDELKFAVVIGNGTLECQARFIVHNVECRRSPDGFEACKHVVVCRYTMTVMFGSKRANQDGIGGCVEAEHDILVATLGAPVEAASIIREEVHECKFVEFKR